MGGHRVLVAVLDVGGQHVGADGADLVLDVDHRYEGSEGVACAARM